LPLAVPKDLSPRISEFHGNPFVWWSGQILTYLMRFQPEFEKEVQEFSKKISFKTPCVG
jgi:glycoprotein 6-alpha-L-fucosyltransferase